MTNERLTGPERLSQHDFLEGARRIASREGEGPLRGRDGRARVLVASARLSVAAVEQAHRMQTYARTPQEFFSKVAATLVQRGLYDEQGERAILLAVAGCDEDPQLLERYASEEADHEDIPLVHHAITNLMLQRCARSAGASTRELFEELVQTS